ncbi:MAG: DUF2225 domain-containing protein [Leptonema sp. (in: Bacteria)]|nr:DUF2225 domain-containing protein [Leptonema sp. (in: bacteria)]
MLGGPKKASRNISFRSKDQSYCPVCNHGFTREQLLTGGGRLIAGNLSKELRRGYNESRKFGRVIPLIYPVVVCPQCLYSSFQNDFNMIEPVALERLRQGMVNRRTGIEKIVGPLDFNEDRHLIHGAASYLLAIDCYQQRGIEVAPTPKKAICSMRAAWLFGDIHDEFPDMGFNQIRDFMYLKAVQYYRPVLEIMSRGNEPHDQFTSLLGPDTDKNWGFDGVIYLNGLLTFKYIDSITKDHEKQVKYLDEAKRYLGKLYGMGKSSKSKPSVIIDLAKDLYDELNTHLQQLTGQNEEVS